MFFIHAVSNSSNNHIGASHIYDLDELDDVITTYMRERKIPGASVAISKGGQFLMRKGLWTNTLQSYLIRCTYYNWQYVSINKLTKQFIRVILFLYNFVEEQIYSGLSSFRFYSRIHERVVFQMEACCVREKWAEASWLRIPSQIRETRKLNSSLL